MKTKNLMYLLLSLTCLFHACTNSDVEIPTIKEQESEATTTISLNAAKDLLEDFVDGVYARSNTSFKIKNHQIKTVYIEASEGILSKEAIPIYEFITETDGKEGYSVVVGDKRVEKVLISVPHGSLSDTAHIEPLRLYFRDIPLLIEQDLKQYNEGIQETTIMSRMTAETCYRFTSTIWGQGNPYNSLCPNQAPAGCLAIAVSQIFAYHRIPSNYDWTSILASSTVTTSSSTTVISQVSNLIYNVGVSLNTIYTDTVSTAYLEVSPTVLRNYGLQCGGVIPFSIEDGKYSLENGGPFIMYGINAEKAIGHAWVCDGWKRHIYDDATYYDYLNMNWGWDGISNGFYYVENPMSFKAGGNLFNSNFKMIYNIRK